MAQLVRELFRESPKDFRPVPWWCWTGDMTKEGMDKQLLAMREQGIYEFFVFAIYGLDVEFNSDAYFDMVKHAVDRCREWGLKCWIYDEYNWPSGICGGKVLREHPWTRSRTLRYQIVTVEPSQEVDVEVKGELVRAFFVCEGEVTDLTACCSASAEQPPTLRWHNNLAKPCQLVTFSVSLYEHVLTSACGAVWTWNQPGYLDVMNPDAVRVFINYCYEPYAERFGEHLGREIVGFFTDEPGLYPDGDSSLPYTLHLSESFSQWYGYSLEAKLHELVLQAGDWQTTRADYWRLVSDLFANSYIGQINTWCVQHGLKFTGHFPGEEALLGNVRYTGNISCAARQMTVPGIDLLGDLTSYDPSADMPFYGGDPRVLNTAAKVVSSAADYVGAQRRMVEAYGTVDWDQSLSRMKRLVDWLAAMGFNLINDNTLVYSLQGFRKRRVSGKNFTTPWFPYYGRFSEHVGRVCWMTTVGDPVDEVGVLFPTTSGWMRYGDIRPGSDDAQTWPGIDKALVETGDALNRIHRGWKFLYDQELAGAEAAEGRLVINGLAFTTVILASLLALDQETGQKLIEFAKAGGTLLLVGLRALLSPTRHWDVSAAVEELLQQPNAAFLPNPVWGEAYESWLDEHIPKATFAFTGPGSPQILAAQRRDDTHEYLFVSNQTQSPAPICVSSPVKGTWELWDPDTGGQWLADTTENERSEGGAEHCWSGVMAPMQSLFLVVRRGQETQDRPSPPFLFTRQVVEKTLVEGVWGFERLGPNLVLLDLAIRPDSDSKGLQEGYQHGRDGEWVPTDEGKTDIKLDPDELAYFWLKAEIDLSHVPADLELVLDSRDYAEVFVNGSPLDGGQQTTIWDEANWAFPLPEFVSKGRNVVVMRCRPSKYFAARVAGTIIDPYYVEPVVLRGGFRAFREGSGPFEVVPDTGEIRLGAWEDQGHPAFCGTAVYRKSVEIPEVEGRYWLVLDDVRQVAEVEVNGRTVGARLWPPYEYDITSNLQPGPNEFAIRVTNSFGRLLRHSYTGPISHEVLSGLIGPVWLVTTAT